MKAPLKSQFFTIEAYAEALEKQNAELLAALKELVDLKAMKTYWDTHEHMRHVYWVKDHRNEYLIRKPFAWERAAALVQPSTQEVSNER